MVSDFSERDVIKHVTKFQPSDHTFIAPLFNFNARRPYGYKGPLGDVVVDGFVFDFGENNRYCVANVDDERTGTPNKGVLTGRILCDDESPAVPKEGYMSGDEYALHMDVEGNVRVSNCIFVNCRDYGLNALMGKGHMEVCNNIFISCKYAACQIKGNVRDDDIDKVSLDFHHNTVLFTWTRNKTYEDMGQGFRFMNGIRTIDVHNNIFDPVLPDRFLMTFCPFFLYRYAFVVMINNAVPCRSALPAKIRSAISAKQLGCEQVIILCLVPGRGFFVLLHLFLNAVKKILGNNRRYPFRDHNII